MFKEIRPALILLIALTLLTGLAYPLAITGLAAIIFPYQSQGSLIERDGKVIGSELIGQAFASDRYFHGRPSATTGPDPADPSKTVPSPYNAANSMASNLGPTSKVLADRMKQDVDKLKSENPNSSVPVDLVTTSGSGLDPDISPEQPIFRFPALRKRVAWRKIAFASWWPEH
jgi:potassium-transporting ATPase KdpC subunit